MQSNECSIEGCTNPKKPSRRLCSAHCTEFERSGQSSLRTPEERFWMKVRRSDDSACWLWLGHLTKDGYGTFWLKEMMNAHRASYMLFVGAIPAGSEIDHLCRNRACVNPAHLEAVDHNENMRRARITHCKRGHEFTEANSYLPPRGSRACKECWNRRSACPKCGVERSHRNMASHLRLMHST